MKQKTVHRLATLLMGGKGGAGVTADLGLLIARVSIGLFTALGHGWGKVFPPGGFGPDEQMISGVRAMGFPLPTFFAWSASLSELLGGLLLALGLFTRPSALFVAITMFIAAFVVHADAPLFGPPPNKEYALLFFIPAVMFMFTGPGRFSIDASLRRQVDSPRYNLSSYR